MATRFTAQQSVEITVPDESISIQHYLRQPHRLINALVDVSRIQQISSDVFRYRMRALSFMSLKIQPIVDMRIWTETNGVVRIESTGCEILGIEGFNQRFSLQLQGHLSPEESPQQTRLKGVAYLQVNVDLPPPFSLTPRPILEATGNGLLKSILLTIHQRLRHQLLTDYRQWVRLQVASSTPNQRPHHPEVNPDIGFVNK